MRKANNGQKSWMPAGARNWRLILEQLVPSCLSAPFKKTNQNWHIRRPDYEEEQAGLFLQIWGEEGYWHIVDQETKQLLNAVSQPTNLSALLKTHPEWAPKQDLVFKTLQSVTRGMAYVPQPTACQIENVSLNLTTGCNLRCATCYVPVQDRGHQKLDVSKAIAFLEKLENQMSPTATISLLGGEPFLHTNGILALAGWAHKKGRVCTVSTNGTVPLNAVARQIQEVSLRVQISIDGARAMCGGRNARGWRPI